MIASGVVPGPYSAKLASGTMVSVLVLTEAPVEALPRPLLVSALSARFWAAFDVAVKVEVLLLAPVLVVLPALASPVVLEVAGVLAAIVPVTVLEVLAVLPEVLAALLPLVVVAEDPAV